MLALWAMHGHCDLTEMMHINQEVECWWNKQDQLREAKQLSEQGGGHTLQ